MYEREGAPRGIVEPAFHLYYSDKPIGVAVTSNGVMKRRRSIPKYGFASLSFSPDEFAVLPPLGSYMKILLVDEARGAWIDWSNEIVYQKFSIFGLMGRFLGSN